MHTPKQIRDSRRYINAVAKKVDKDFNNFWLKAYEASYIDQDALCKKLQKQLPFDGEVKKGLWVYTTSFSTDKEDIGEKSLGIGFEITKQGSLYEIRNDIQFMELSTEQVTQVEKDPETFAKENKIELALYPYAHGGLSDNDGVYRNFDKLRKYIKDFDRAHTWAKLDRTFCCLTAEQMQENNLKL